jgi:Protein of unknown function (DUF4238)
MSAGRFQHYIPRFYLQNFELRGSPGHLSLYHIRKGKFVQFAALKKQAREPHFYGKYGLDDLLSSVEQYAAPILAKIIERQTLPPQDSSWMHWVVYFAVTLQARTKASASDLSEAIGTSIKDLMLLDSEMRPIVQDLVVRIEKPQELQVPIAIRAAERSTNLHSKLLIASSDFEFIISDKPVAKYNQWAETRKLEIGATGIGSKGLQMFLPIHPKMCLMLYDGAVYKVGSRRSRTVLVTANDVLQMNRIQLCAAKELVYGSDWLHEDYLKSELKGLDRIRDRTKIAIRHFDTEDPLRKVQSVSNVEAHLNLHLSFVGLTDKGKREPLQDTIVQVRSGFDSRKPR